MLRRQSSVFNIPDFLGAIYKYKDSVTSTALEFTLMMDYVHYYRFNFKNMLIAQP